jgi:excinuclease UvrABC nuclease subunit
MRTLPYVYRAYNEAGDLLYVGSTHELGTRMDAHASQSTWWADAKRLTFTTYSSRADAYLAELGAIRCEYPRWNIRDRAKDHPDGKARAWWDVALLYPTASEVIQARARRMVRVAS